MTLESAHTAKPKDDPEYYRAREALFRRLADLRKDAQATARNRVIYYASTNPNPQHPSNRPPAPQKAGAKLEAMLQEIDALLFDNPDLTGEELEQFADQVRRRAWERQRGEV